MVDDCPATEVVDLQAYGISFQSISNSFKDNFNCKWLKGEDRDSYASNFSLSFLKEFFPLEVGPLGESKPKLLKNPRIKKGSALFFDGRVLHYGPPCDNTRWLLYRNYVPDKLIPYHRGGYSKEDKNTPQYRAQELLKIIHYNDDESLTQVQYDNIKIDLV